LGFLVAATLLLSGCPLTDHYAIEKDDAVGAGSSIGTEAGGNSGVSSARGGGAGDGMPGTSGTSANDASGGFGVGERAGAGGNNGSRASGCVSVAKQGHEYVFCFSPSTQAEARAYCNDHGTTLAVIEDQAENTWIANEFSAEYGGESPRAFIGANDVSNEGEWRWADGVTFWRSGAPASGRYANWASGEPNDSSPSTGASEDCLSIGFSDATWDDVSCTAELPYVCEPR